MGECVHAPGGLVGEGEVAGEVGKGAVEDMLVGLGLWLTWSGEGISV